MKLKWWVIRSRRSRNLEIDRMVQISEGLKASRAQLRDLQALTTHAALVARAHKDVERLTKEIGELETELQSSGSTRTPDDVQAEVDEVSARM